jgi:hypothetical protein
MMKRVRFGATHFRRFGRSSAATRAALMAVSANRSNGWRKVAAISPPSSQVQFDSTKLAAGFVPFVRLCLVTPSHGFGAARSNWLGYRRCTTRQRA